VTDEEILSAYRLLAQKEGIFGEPASAASVAGLLKATAGGLDLKGRTAVAIITGSGLKDPDTAVQYAEPLTSLPTDFAAIEKALGLG